MFAGAAGGGHGNVKLQACTIRLSGLVSAGRLTTRWPIGSFPKQSRGPEDPTDLHSKDERETV